MSVPMRYSLEVKHHVGRSFSVFENAILLKLKSTIFRN